MESQPNLFHILGEWWGESYGVNKRTKPACSKW